MKIVRFIVFYFIVFVQPNGGFAQQYRLIGLSNYLIPLHRKGAYIAKAFDKHNAEAVIKIEQDSSVLFRIHKGALCLKKKTVLDSLGGSIRYGLSIRINDVPMDVELVKDQFAHNKVVAHRGAWKHHGVSENSLGSLQKAFDIGCEGSEFDVWLSKDQVAFICHDPSIAGKVIEKTNAVELKKIPLLNNEFLPTLEDYIFKGKTQNKTALFLEIKTSNNGLNGTLALTDSVFAIVRRLKAEAWIKYISFSYDALLHLKKLDPFVSTAYLAGDKSIDQVKKDGLSGIDYSFYSLNEDKLLTSKAHRIGLSVNVWTVDDLNQLKLFRGQGVDLITTNEPDELMNIVNGKL